MKSLTGYIRPDGRVGIRDLPLVISSVVCANRVTEMIAGQVPGAVSVIHQHGCAQLGADRKQTFRVLSGFGANPNVSCALVVGLGCEAIPAADLAGAMAANGKPVDFINIQDSGGTLRAASCGASLLAAMIRAAVPRREPVTWEDIILGIECGGSDATSGLAANPACGYAADLVVEAGGTVILSETTEMIGAEHLLAKRARNEEVAAEIYRIVRETERRAMATGEDIRGTQPAPGNIAGGLTTIEEKSLGCLHKAGTSPVNEVVEYASRPTRRGLVIMDTPGHDVESVTAMVAGGAQIIVFTTGRGTPTGCPIAPVIKVTGNSATAVAMADNIDIDASGIISAGEETEEVGRGILDRCSAVINGEQARAEILGHREFAIFRTGFSL
ncbi:MAG: UxaA family hydrolase [Bacillota bacterium]